MSHYIATFYSHYDALTFFNALKPTNATAKLMPVPRKVSASCGTCVFFASDRNIDFTGYELEEIYVDLNGTYCKASTVS